MVTREQILETERKCEEIRKKYDISILNEGDMKFNSVEEVRAFYKSIPLDEFIKKVKSGK